MMEKVEGRVQLLREWMSLQPHLPQEVPDIFLKKCFIASNYSVELSKKLIDLFFTLRSRTPDLFANRDLNDPGIKAAIESFDIFELSKMVDASKVIVGRLNTDDLNKFHCLGALKLFTMINDIQIFTDDRFYKAEIAILDLEKTSIKHLTKISLPLVKKLVEYLQEARPLNLKQIHFVHVSPFLEKVLLLIKPILKAQVLNMMSFHQDVESLHKFVPKDVLPKEFGGTDGLIEDYRNEWYAKLRKYKDIIDNENYRKVDESKRPSGNPYGNKFGLSGSFRTLDID